MASGRDLRKLLLALGMVLAIPGAGASFPEFAAAFAGVNFTIRCQNWIGESSRACGRLSVAMVDGLDFEADERTGSLAFLKSELVKFGRSPEIVRLLRQMDFKLQLLRQGAYARVDLYGLAVEHFRERGLANPAGRAHLLFATLFQDNKLRYHLNWLRHRAKENVHPDFEPALAAVLDRIQASAENAEWLDRIDFYPPSIESSRAHFNDKIYYYYLPWVLARKTEAAAAKFSLPADRLAEYRRLARTLPVMMSLIYKYHHAHKATSKSAREVYRKTLFERPYPTAEETAGGLRPLPGGDGGWPYRYRDLYMAYLGAENVQAEPSHPSSALPYAEFERGIALMPTRTIRRIYERRQHAE